MKYFKRLKIYKANNVTFNPETLEAYSYRWWKFVALVDDKVIFNDYRYSNMTTKHQWKVRGILNELRIKIDISAPFPKGIGPGDLETLILQAEENLCDAFLHDEERRIRRNERAAQRRAEKKNNPDPEPPKGRPLNSYYSDSEDLAIGCKPSLESIEGGAMFSKKSQAKLKLVS